jgi:hypothetical protein
VKNFKIRNSNFNLPPVLVIIFGIIFFMGFVRSPFFLFLLIIAIPFIKKRFFGKKQDAFLDDADANYEREVQHPQKQESPEHLVLKAARAENGKLTPALLSLSSSMTLSESEQLLEDLTKRGFCSLEVTSEGRLVYLFPEFLPEAAKTKYLD